MAHYNAYTLMFNTTCSRIGILNTFCPPPYFFVWVDGPAGLQRGVLIE